MGARIILTVIVMALWGLAQAVLHVTGTVLSPEMATGQMANSDSAAVNAQLSLATLTALRVPGLLLLVILVVIWFGPLRRLLMRPRTRRLMAAVVLAGLAASPAHAFYATTDVTEVVYILPNWSAFFIPDTGANRDTQAAFGSVEYLNTSKIAAKRFIIPHAKLSGTGGTSLVSGPDYYVPTGRMIIVDRTPFFREWVDAADRGTSRRREGFRFESRDSVNIGTGITVSAYVTEQNAATFLYWFGTRAVDGDTSRPEVQFASVLRGMTLAEVMDGIVRAKVQEQLASEFGRRSFDTAIAEKGPIIKAVMDAVKAEFEPKGISIGFLGYAGPLDFSDAIQASIDATVIATRQRDVAATIKDSLPVLQQKALIDAVTMAAAKFDGHLPALPSVVVLPEAMGALLSGIAKPASPR